MAGIIKHTELDKRLSALAQDQDSYEAQVALLARELDGKNLDLEMTDPAEWRNNYSLEAADGVVTLRNQLRAEIEAIEVLDREPEAELARRIEFARTRLELALEKHGLDQDDLQKGTEAPPWAERGAGAGECHLPGNVCRRWMEYHLLRTEMVERNLYLVLINVERYAHTSASRQDLIQEGASSLFRAVDGFDWRRGLLFRTYAVHWLNQAFRSHLYNFGNTVRVPVYLQKAMKHVYQAIERLGNPNATAAEVAAEAGLGEKLVATALQASRSTRSLDAPLGDDDRAALAELLSVEDEDGPYSPELEDISLSQGIDMALDRLSDRERLVVSKRFGVGEDREYTLAEVAGELGVSLERVRQIQVRAIAKMGTPSLRKAIDPWLN